MAQRRGDSRARTRPARNDDGDYDDATGFPWPRVIIVVVLILLLGAGFVAGYLVLDQGRNTPAAAETAAAVPGTETVTAASTASTATSTPASIPASAPAAQVTAAAEPGATPAPAATAAAVTSVKTEKIGDWFLVCPHDATDTFKCVVQQQLRAPDGKQVVLVWTLRKDAQGTVHALWQMPAGLIVQHGLVFDIGDGKARTVPFTACDDRSCTVQASLLPDYLAKLEASQSIAATVAPAAANARPVRFVLSSKGLTEALARLSPPPAS